MDHGAKVINMSFVTPSSSYSNHCPEEVQEAIRYAVDKGTVLVAGAGNNGNLSNEPQYPTACAGVVAVGAINGSKHIWDRSERQSYVDVAAPGMTIASINASGQAGTSAC